MSRSGGKSDSKWDLSKWNLDESRLSPGDSAWYGNKSNEKRPNLWDSIPVNTSRRAGKDESQRSLENVCDSAWRGKSNEKRSNGWDLKEECRLSEENVQGNPWLGKNEKKPNPWFSIPVTRGGHDDDSSRRPRDRSYDAPLSPAGDDWRRHHRQSPKNERNSSRRVHERSRSVSRSPVRGYRRESDFPDRSRSRSGAPAQRCKDYAVLGSTNGNGERERDKQNRDSLERATERGPRGGDITPCKFFAAGNCRNGKYCRFFHDGDTYKSPDRRLRDDRRVQSHYSDRDKSWGSPMRRDTDPPRSDTWKSSNDKMGRTNVLENDDRREQSRHSNWEKSWGDTNLPRSDTWNSSYSDREKSWGSPKWSGKNPPLSDTWKSSNDKMERTNVPDLQIRPYSNDDKEVLKTKNSTFNSAITDTSDAHKWIDHEKMSPGLNFGTETRKNVVKEDHGHFIQSSQIPTLNDNSVHTMENVYEAVKTEPMVIEKSYLKPDDDIALRFEDENTAGILPTQLNDLSASLAQVFGGPQLSQSYNTLNSVELKTELTPKNVPVNLTAVSEEPKVKNEGGAEEKSTGQGNGEEGGEEKKSKSEKAVRLFKFSLTDFVKELLKPAWKEGQVKKDDYKNIVKKAVDKVTGTMKGANVPQTQEKIDQYLSRSKPKLTKLVQGYVEKFKKGPKEA